MLNENLTYYDALEITPDASIEEIKEAYLRIKTTYQKEHVALYTIFSAAEREEILKKAEEAYLILSDRDKRRNYDQNHGLIVWEENPFKRKELPPNTGEAKIEEAPAPLAEIISIDRSPPMAAADTGEESLISPVTDFTHSDPPNLGNEFKSRSNWSSDSNQKPARSPSSSTSSSITSINPKKTNSTKIIYDSALALDIQTEKIWPGSFLKKLREENKISIEEISESTKVSKTYIQAIEEENFNKLPAPVYVRGFILQISRALKLPGNEVAKAYLSRYQNKLTG
jgi:curved DNA-binding protein CbpA